MNLKYCKPDLTSRQMLWGICSEVSDLRTGLIENCLIDSNLFSSDHFSAAMVHLRAASNEINALRSIASPALLGDLANSLTDLESLINSI